MKDLRDYKTKICDGIGDKDHPKYMLVGMCGGRLGCIQTGVPFTRDGSGKLLIRVLNELGYTKDYEWNENPQYKNIYVTNLVKGVILGTDGNNRAPTDDEIQYWMKSFIEEIVEVNPEHVVAIGHVVESAIEKVIHNCTFCEGETFTNYEVLFVKHPSYYLRNGALGKANNAWKSMLDEYTKILGKNEKQKVSTEI